MLDKLLKMSQTDVVRNRKGFTLIELMVVITVIAILTAIALIGMRAAQASARNATRYQRYNALRAALESCYSANQAYPVDKTNTCWLAVVTQAQTAIPGSAIAELANYTQTGGGTCYTLTVNIEPSGAYPTVAGSCPQ